MSATKWISYAGRINELAKQYHWKAQNIVRFFDGLGMTTVEKQDFLAKELASAHFAGEFLPNPSDKPPTTPLISEPDSASKENSTKRPKA